MSVASMSSMSMDDSLEFVPSRPVPAKPPKRMSTTTQIAVNMAGLTNFDTVQEATALSGSESDEQQNLEQSRPRRRGSFSFLTRSKSHEVPVTRSPSGRRMLRNKRLRDQEERRRQEQQMPVVSHSPPTLPILPNMEPIEGARPDSVAIVSGRGHDYRSSPPPANFSRPGAKQTSMSNSSMPSMSSTGSLNNPNSYGVPLPPMPESLPRTESIVSRGRESYAPSISANMHSPRRMRRRKEPEAFNILITGAKGSGKTSFVEFLKTALALPPHKQTRGHTPPPHMHNESPFEPSYVETDIEGERVGVTLWDSQGLEKSIIDLQLRDLAAFVESKFEETFNQESRVVRTPGVKDTHIHCVLLLLDPARLDSTMRSAEHSATKKSTGAEDEALDLDVIRGLESKTTVIPIIAKADTLTAAHMAHLKRLVWSNVKNAKLDPLEALSLDEEDEDDSPDYEALDSEFSSSESGISQAARSSPHKVTEDTNAEESDTMGSTFSPVRKSSRAMLGPVSSKRADSCTPAPEELFLPFSILSPDSHTSPGALTRVFPWGEADPCNPAHCDYIRLRECVFGDWRSDLRLTSREKWYENWRTSRLKRNPTSRVRVSGGVTPIAAVPKEGRTVSPTLTSRSRAVSASKQASRMYDEVPERPRTISTSKAERVLGSPRGIAL